MQLYKNKILESYLSNEKLKNIDTLILGCTHYPLIESQINEFYKNNIKLISALNYIGTHVKSELEKINLLNLKPTQPRHQFYVSHHTQQFQEKTKLFFPSSIILEEENIFS